MVLSDFYILEHTQGVFGQHRRGTIQRHQVGGYRVAVNTHETDGKAGSLFAWQSGLKESHYALLPLAGAEQQDTGLPCRVNIHLVGGNQRDASPGQEWRTENGGRGRRDTAEGALAAKGGEGTGMSQEEGRFFPDTREQFIQIVGGGRSLAGLNLECGVDVV